MSVQYDMVTSPAPTVSAGRNRLATASGSLYECRPTRFVPTSSGAVATNSGSAGAITGPAAPGGVGVCLSPPLLDERCGVEGRAELAGNELERLDVASRQRPRTRVREHDGAD